MRRTLLALVLTAACTDPGLDPEVDPSTEVDGEVTPVPEQTLVDDATADTDPIALVFGTAFTPPAGVKPGFPTHQTYVAGEILAASQLPCQGRLAAIAYIGGWVYTSIESPSGPTCSDKLERVWDISNPRAPKAYVTAAPGQVPNPAYMAHAVQYKDDMVQVGTVLRAPQFGGAITALSYGAATAAGFRYAVGDRSTLTYGWSANSAWSYHPFDFAANPNAADTQIRRYGVVQSPVGFSAYSETGITGHSIILGNLLIYASDQSKRGVATYDISDPTHPRQLDVLKLRVGSYWPEIWGHYVIFAGETLQVVDFADPTNLRLVAEVPTPGSGNAVYPHCQDEFCFYSTYKIDMRTVASNPVVTRFGVAADGKTKLIEASHWQLPLGNLLVIGGNGVGGWAGKGGLSIVAHQAQPDTRGPFVAHHVPRSGQTRYPVGAPISVLIHETLDMRTVTTANIHLRAAGSTTDVPVDITFTGTGLMTIAPKSPLALNTSYTVSFAAGGVRDVVGNAIEPYAFTFSTGASAVGSAPAISSLHANSPIARGGSSTLSVAATDPDGPLAYRFDFGDGSARTAWGAATTASHAYAHAGHYVVQAQVRDRFGNVATRSTGVTVAPPAPAAKPAQSSRFAAASASTVFVVNPDNSTITGLDRTSLATSVPEVRVAANPRSIAVDASGRLWVAARDADVIEVRTGTSGALVATIPLGWGAAPEAIVMSPDRSTAYVSLSGPGRLVKIATATRAITASLNVGPTAGALAITADGARVLVARTISAQIAGEVWDVTTAGSMALARTIRLQPSLGFGTDGKTNPDGAENGRGVPNYLTSIAIAPDGKAAWITASKPNVFRGLFVDAPGRDLEPDKSVRSIVCVIDLATGAERVEARRDIDNAEGPSAIAFSPLGDYAFVGLRGNNAVTVIDALVNPTDPLLLGIHSVRGRYAVGAAPRSVWVDPASQRLWVANDLDRSVSVLSFAPLTSAGAALAPVGTPVTSKAPFETLSAQVLRGKRLFYDAEGRIPGSTVFRMSSEGYIACASCHLDGASDQRVWDFTGRGEGLRNTISLLGRSGTGMGRVHWSGNFDEIQDFEQDIRKGFGGAGLMTDAAFTASSAPLGTAKAGRSADLDALAAYVTSIGRTKLRRSPYRNPDGTMTATGIAGRAVYDANGCATCHGSALFTESKLAPVNPLRNVGTLTTGSGRRLGQPLSGLDTPTLLDLWESAPYLHDGSAETLAAVFARTGGVTLQGETGALSGGGTSFSRVAHGGATAMLAPIGSSVAFGSVDGGAGGAGVVTIRYGSTHTGSFDVRVNNKVYTAQAIGNQSYAFAYGLQVAVPVTLAAGRTNTITITSRGQARLDVDEVTISTPAHLAAARVHTRVPGADRAALIAYLVQLDR